MREGLRDVWALVPIKSFAAAKTRLAPVLGSTMRAALAKAMAKDVLELLINVEGLKGVLVVTNDFEAKEIARARSVRVIADPQEPGTNAAVRRGLRHLHKLGAGGVLIAASDLPFLSPQDVEVALAALKSAAVVIAPAGRDGGTNLLGLRGADVIAPQFGKDSFTKHLAEADRASIEPVILRTKGTSTDIDDVDDLAAAVQENCIARHTGAVLAPLKDVLPADVARVC